MRASVWAAGVMVGVAGLYVAFSFYVDPRHPEYQPGGPGGGLRSAVAACPDAEELKGCAAT